MSGSDMEGSTAAVIVILSTELLVGDGKTL